MEKNVVMYRLALDDGYQSHPLIIQTTPEKAQVINAFLNILEGWDEWSEHEQDDIIFEPVEQSRIIFEL